MANLTITVDEHVLEKAKIRAIRQKTSVNAVLARYLETFAQGFGPQGRVVNELLELSDVADTPEARARAKKRGRRTWKRADLHER